MNQEARHTTAVMVAWGSWLAAFGLTALRVTDRIGPTIGIVIVLFIGTAIAAGTALSRMRLTATMTGVFRAGMAAAEERAVERATEAIQNGNGHDDDSDSRQGVDSSRD